AAGRHPVAGLLGGFAAAGAGYSTNIFPTSLDALFAGITTSVMDALPGYEFTAVNPVSNWFFNIASSIVLGFVAGFIIDRLIEPRIVRQGVSRDEIAVDDDSASGDDAEQMRAALTPIENKGLLLAVLSAMALTALILAAVLVPASPWRNEDGGLLHEYTLLASIVFIDVALIMLVGAIFGLTHVNLCY